MFRFFRSLASLARSFLSLAAPATIFALHLGVMLCFINRWDALVTVTLIPIWAWAGLGMALSLIFWFILKSRLLVLTFAIWLATGIFCADESPGLFRALKAAVGISEPGVSTADTSARLRIVTVNCADGSRDAAEAVKALEPDVVFLQEAPSDPAVIEQITRELFDAGGSFLRSDSRAILARGSLVPVDLGIPFSGMMATAEIPGIPPIDLINLHLTRAIPRKDFWNPVAWKTFTAIRQSNRQSLRKAVGRFPQRPAGSLQIVGGDFGTPANDDIYRMLRSNGFQDSFRKAGVGWGNTYSSRQPFLRIDQVWSSKRLEPLESRTALNPHTDHRMVVSDYRISGPGDLPDSR